MVSRRRRWLVAASGLVAAGVVLAVALTVGSGGGKPHSPVGAGAASAQPSGSLPPALDAKAAAALSSELTSGQPSSVAKAVALPSGQPVPAGFAAEMAKLRALRVQPGSFNLQGDGTATVRIEVTTPAGQSQEWTGILVVQDGSWRLASTTTAAG